MDDLRLIDLMADSYNADHVFTYQTDAFHATLEEIDGAAIVVPRGSKSALDWIMDCDAIPVEHRGYWFHAGFLKDVLPVVSRIQADISADKPLWFVGHSKGGAEAVDLAVLFALDGRLPAGLVTCGAPKAIYASVARLLDPVEKRQYWHGHDPVPELPMTEVLLLDYAHASIPIRVGERDTYPNAFDFHHLDGYRAAVQAHLKP